MTKLPNRVEFSVSVTPDWPTFVSELRRMADAIEAQAEAARECRTEERLVALFREHDYERMECHDHGGLCDQAGCHDLREDQAQHYARVVLALLPQRCAPTEEEVARALFAHRHSTEYWESGGSEGRREWYRAEAEAITALYAAQPTVREAKAEGWRRGYSDACKRYGHELGTYGEKIPASPFDHSEADHG